MNRTRPASTTRTRDPRPARALLVAAAWLLAGVARADEPPRAPTTGPVLNLVDGGFTPGELVESDRPGVVRWQAPAFVGPFDLPLDGVASIRFPTPEKPPRPAGTFGFELSGGDVLYGSLVALDEKSAVLAIPRLGRLDVDRSRFRRIFRWQDGTDLIYNGPNGLAGWREFVPVRPRPQAANRNGVAVALAAGRAAAIAAEPAAKSGPAGPKWRDEGGQLVTDQEGATIQADVGLPARASLDLELSWKQKPDFSLAIGIGDTLDDQTAGRAFRLEVWNGQLVALRETEREADLAPIQAVADGPGLADLQVFLDQERGRLMVFSTSGETLADLELGGRPGPALPGLRLTSHRGDLRVERLRVARWDGSTPRPNGADPSRLQLVDGSIVRGPVERFDADAREFVVRGESGEVRVADDRVASVQLARPSKDAPAAVQAAYHDGTRIGGEWVKVEGGALTLKSPGIAGALRLPLEGMRAPDVPRHDGKPRERDALTGTLEIDGLRLVGRLGDSDGGGLAWRPLAGESSSRLRPETSGKIVYRTPPPKAATFRQPTPTQAVVRRNVVNGVVEAIQHAADRGPTAPATRRSLYLRTGDIIPSEVVKIDGDGVTFRTEFSASTFVPNDRVKAVELATEVGALIRVDKAKRERLLTLPRMQKGSPPTHLIRSKNGDFLRGRVVATDDRTVRFEVRLEEKEIPRDRISRIIWFHADEADPSKKPAEAPVAAPANRVQAVRTDGIRLTFVAERFADGTLSGKSDVLGPVQVRPQDLDQLLIGGSVEKEATQLAYQSWKLQDAPEPKSSQPDSGGAEGTESALVGKPAPDFTLDLLGGKKFHLAENKGKVIVLDFWATWCGPCLQAMPQIDKVTHEFADKGVQLIAVNLQETPDKITALLERQKLSPAVALDRDGVVAEKYAANAIPQTVVIDREGKVTRLFIGGGPHLGDQLREALQALMPGDKP